MWEWSRSLTSLGTRWLKEREEKKQVRKDPPSDAGRPGKKKIQTKVYRPELICICIGHLGNTDKTLFIFQGNSGNISSNIRA